MKNVIVVGILALLALSANGCSSSSSAQSGPVLQPVLASGGILFLTANGSGNAFFFLDDDGVTGFEPWYATGDGAPAQPVGDLFPGPGDSLCGNGVEQSAVSDGEFVYFWANDGVNGCEVWRTDGTPGGTILFSDTIPGPLGFASGGDLVVSGTNLFLKGQVASTQELYVINLN